MEENSQQSEPVDDSPLLHVKIMTIGEVATLARNSDVRDKRVAVISSGFVGHIPALIHAIHAKHPDIDVVVMEKKLTGEGYEDEPTHRVALLEDSVPPIKKFDLAPLDITMAEPYVKPHNQDQPWKDRHSKHNFNNRHNFKGGNRGRNNFKNRKK